MYGFISERPATRHDSDAALGVNVGWHDSDLALARRYDTRAVRTYQPSSAIAQIIEDANHIESGYSFGYADSECKARVGCFHDRIRCERWRNIYHACIRTSLFHGFHNRIEDWHSAVFRSSFTGRYSRNYLRAISDHLPGVKGSLFPGNALNDNASVLIDEYAQAALPGS